MSRHSFDPEVAIEHGVNAAVIYQNIVYWVEKNEANDKNFRDGRYWTYNSYPAFAKLFPYLTQKQIRTALEKLIESGLIIKGNFNEDRFLHTNWYALGKPICPEGQNEKTKKADGSDLEGRPPAPEGRTYKEEQIKTKNKPNTRARDNWDLSTKFVPQGSRDVDLQIWKMALDGLGIFPMERVFELKWQNREEGWIIPVQIPPKGEDKRLAFLRTWLEAQGKELEVIPHD